MRVQCDTSCFRLGAALEQLTVDRLKSIVFTYQFVNSCEERQFRLEHCLSSQELEPLSVVCSIDSFKNFLYGKQLKVITDHRTRFSILNLT